MSPRQPVICAQRPAGQTLQGRGGCSLFQSRNQGAFQEAAEFDLKGLCVGRLEGRGFQEKGQA